MEKILITGSEGFIGKHLITKLLSMGYKVHGISIESKPSIKHPNYHYSRLDVLNREKLNSKFGNLKFNAVVHLAALTTHDEMIKSKEKTLRINLEGVLNLLEVFKKQRSKKFIYASTGKVYGRIHELPLSESHSTDPVNILGKTKLIAEKLIDFFSNGANHQYIILRLFNVYGPGQREYFLVPTIISQLKGGNSKITLGNIQDKRDYIFVEDVVEAIVTIIEKKLPENLNIFNVGSGKPYSVADIIEIFEKIFNRKISVNVDKSRLRKDEFPKEYADIRKLLSFGWSPGYDLKSGLEKTASIFFE